MHGKDAQSHPFGDRDTVSLDVARAHRSGIYQRVLDGRKHPIRGLWIRNGHYYARLNFADPQTGTRQTRRVRLTKALTLSQAQAELRRLQTRRETEELPVLRRCPKFRDYLNEYHAYYEKVTNAKRPRTIATEKGHLRAWEAHLGETRLNHITPAMIRAFMAKRQGEGVSGRTVNLAIVILRNVLKRGIEDGWLRRLPTETIKPLKWTPRIKKLFQLDVIERLCAAAAAPRYSEGRVAQPGETGIPLKNAQAFADYIRLMAFCGARMTETLHLKWSDVNWERKQLTIGSDGETKNGKPRRVDFNPHLETHLQAMLTRRAPDSDWIFPSPQRGDRDIRTRTFRESLILARTAAGLPTFGFHDCRHFFCSYCVMSGIDYMTIAQWAGHQDGGILIGKVYGHLADEHTRRMAQKVRFTPTDEKDNQSQDHSGKSKAHRSRRARH
jgi:integrase